MYREMAQVDMNHHYSKEVVGLGNKIIIPDLSMDGSYGMSMLKRAGFISLIAVPITTYKVLGVMGAAYKVRKKFGNDFPQLFAVIANLVGMSLNKSMINEYTRSPEDTLISSGGLIIKNNNEEIIKESAAVIGKDIGTGLIYRSEDRNRAFKEHVNEIIDFLKS